MAFRLNPHIDQVWIRPGFSSLINVWSVKTIYLEQCVCSVWIWPWWPLISAGAGIAAGSWVTREECVWIQLRNEIECVCDSTYVLAPSSVLNPPSFQTFMIVHISPVAANADCSLSYPSYTFATWHKGRRTYLSGSYLQSLINCVALVSATCRFRHLTQPAE